MGPLSTDVANALQGSPLLEAFLGQSGLVYIAFIAVLASWWLLWKTRFGLRLRAVGENPSMVESAGVSVQRMRYSALVINGLLCGLAGSYLVLSLSASFVPHMSAGRGFMALAALIFGKWKPKATLLACLLFGFLDAAAIRLQGVVLPTIGEIPVQFIQALPYLLTVILLAGFIGKAVAPKAIGVPYTKERT
jgi:simple sugar transport system permease protein